MRISSFIRGFIMSSLLLIFVCAIGGARALAADAPRPLAPPTALSLQEARVIIDAAVAYAREQKQTMTVVVLDEEGQLISADRMEGASFHLERFAKGKAYASLILRDRTETASELAKS